MNTAATEILGRYDMVESMWAGMYGETIPVPKDDGVCYEFTHVPHVWAECRSCIEWCVNPDA